MISLFEIFSATMPDPYVFFRIAASVAKAAVLGNKTVLGNSVSTFSLIVGQFSLMNQKYYKGILLFD